MGLRQIVNQPFSRLANDLFVMVPTTLDIVASPLDSIFTNVGQRFGRLHETGHFSSAPGLGRNLNAVFPSDGFGLSLPTAGRRPIVDRAGNTADS